MTLPSTRLPALSESRKSPSSRELQCDLCDSEHALHCRARRAWRIALIAYLLPMSIATHWPRLGFGAGGTIDKFVHFLGFGVMAWLMLHAAPRGRAWIGFLIAFAWVYLDERTQAIEILGRTFSFYDMLAGWIGVVCAGAIFALRHESFLVRSAAQCDARSIEATAFSRASTWLRGAAITSAAIVVLGGAMLTRARIAGDEILLSTVVYTIGFAGLFALILTSAVSLRLARFQWQRERNRAAERVTIPAWSWFVAIALCLGLFSAYSAGVEALFGPASSVVAGSDHEGFLILAQGFAVIAALLALCAADALSVWMVQRSRRAGERRDAPNRAHS